MNNKGKCSETPKRKGPMTVKVDSYKRADKTVVEAHKRHAPKK